jgi:hypothetical protein
MMTSDAQVCVETEDRPSLTHEDPLLGEWLHRPESRRPLSSWPPRGEADPDRARHATLGDGVADAWFR